MQIVVDVLCSLNVAQKPLGRNVAGAGSNDAWRVGRRRLGRDLRPGPDGVRGQGLLQPLGQLPHAVDLLLERIIVQLLGWNAAGPRRPGRAIAVLLFAAVPMAAAWLAWAHPDWAGPVFTVGALLALAGVLVERWLFFAQARHLVTLYY